MAQFYHLKDGKCGICGDEWSSAPNGVPRFFEIGGGYEKIIGKYPITRTYKSGQIITITQRVFF